jgi:microcin C transport system substrate-binding protein
MERGPDDAWLRFYLDPGTFADGKPVRAEDVRFTFELLMTKGSLAYRTRSPTSAGVTKARAGALRLQAAARPHPGAGPGQPAGAARARLAAARLRQRRRLRQTRGQRPVPHQPDRQRPQHHLRARPDWWAKDLPVSRGLYNFDHLRIEYFGDTEVARQVLKGGGYDYNREFSATAYTLGYNGAQLDDGRLQRAHLGPAKPQVAQGFVFNLPAAVPGPPRASGTGHALGLRVEQPADDAQPVHPPAELFSNTRWPPARCPMPAS